MELGEVSKERKLMLRPQQQAYHLVSLCTSSLCVDMLFIVVHCCSLFSCLNPTIFNRNSLRGAKEIRSFELNWRRTVLCPVPCHLSHLSILEELKKGREASESTVQRWAMLCPVDLPDVGHLTHLDSS